MGVEDSLVMGHPFFAEGVVNIIALQNYARLVSPFCYSSELVTGNSIFDYIDLTIILKIIMT